MRLQPAFALLAVAALSLTGCTSSAETDAPSPSVTATSASAAPVVEVPVSAVFGEPTSLDRTTYGGSSNGGCVLGPEETMVCTDLSGDGGTWLNSVIGIDQLRNPPSLEAHPPVPLPGFPLTKGVDRLDRVLATPNGYLLAIRNNSGTPSTKLTHVTPAGQVIWEHTVSGPALRDAAVTADEVLLSTDTGISSLLLTDGKQGSTEAPAGTLLAGKTPGRDGFSTFSPGAVGLPKSAGGTMLSLADVPEATKSSCTGSSVPAADCSQIEELYADSDYLVVAKTTADERLTETYNAAGALLWSATAPVTSAARLGETFVLGYAGANKATGATARIAVVAAESGKEIGTTKTLEGGSYYVAGATSDGVIYGVDGDSIPGAYDISYGVMPITVETSKDAAPAAADASSPGTQEPAGEPSDDRTAGWKDQVSASGAFTFQTPATWMVQQEPGGVGDTTTVTDPASGIKISVGEGLTGFGGTCAPGQAGLDESMTVLEEPVPGMHLASTPIGGRTPTLEVEQEGMYFNYSVNMTGAQQQCGMYADLFEWPVVGTVRIGANVSVMELAQTGMAPSDYLGSELHRDLARVLLSMTAAS